MTSKFADMNLDPKALGDYGAARARDLAFDAVIGLWRRRRAAGLKQVDLAERLGRDPGWVSRALKGPGNWTIRTFGELVAAMDGEIEIAVFALEDVPAHPSNYDAYAEFDAPPEPALPLGRSVLDATHWTTQETRSGTLASRKDLPSQETTGLPRQSVVEVRKHAFAQN